MPAEVNERRVKEVPLETFLLEAEIRRRVANLQKAVPMTQFLQFNRTVAGLTEVRS
jgi:hypothetical protein